MAAAMTIQPSSLEDLRKILTDAPSRGAKVGDIDLEALNRVVSHAPEDMTVTVQAGIRLARLQAELARRGQWLPIDPPNPDRRTIGALLATNASGPRRFGYGTIRDYLIGIQVALADGRLIRSGGKVVKNVAGYDLAKLFVGSQGTLGVIVEATFKLRPLPETEEFVQARRRSLDEAGAVIEAVLESELSPVVLDLHRLPLGPGSNPDGFVVAAGFAGTREEVEWELTRADELGVSEAATLEYENRFWAESPSPWRLSVLPSRVVETVRGLGEVPFVARAGNGMIYYRGAAPRANDPGPVGLMQRLKDEFDPRHIFPEWPL